MQRIHRLHLIQNRLIYRNIGCVPDIPKEQLNDEKLLLYCQTTTTTVKKYGVSMYGIRLEKKKIRIE